MSVVAVGAETLTMLRDSDRASVAGALNFGLVGLLLEGAMRTSPDPDQADRLAHALEGWSPLDRLEGQVVAYLGRSPAVVEARRGSSEERLEPGEGLARIHVEQIGLRPALGKDAEDRMHVGIELTLEVSDATGRSPWRFKDVYLHGDERTVPDFLGDPARLRREMDESIDAIAVRISNRLRMALR